MRENRLRQMQDYIMRNETVSLEELRDTFNVSLNTIRRDIRELLKEGSIEKIYGGVCAKRNQRVVPFEQRSSNQPDNKQIIGIKAAQYVEDGDVIYIDSGTTTLHMIEGLKDKKNVTICTNSLSVINNALPYENLNIIGMIGQLERRTNSFIGLSTLQILERYNITKAFMAATGITSIGQVTNSSPLEYEIKKRVVEKIEEVFLLADSSKFGKTALMTYACLKDIDYIITDQIPDNDWKRLLNETTAICVCASSGL